MYLQMKCTLLCLCLFIRKKNKQTKKKQKNLIPDQRLAIKHGSKPLSCKVFFKGQNFKSVYDLLAHTRQMILHA